MIEPVERAELRRAVEARTDLLRSRFAVELMVDASGDRARAAFTSDGVLYGAFDPTLTRSDRIVALIGLRGDDVAGVLMSAVYDTGDGNLLDLLHGPGLYRGMPTIELEDAAAEAGLTPDSAPSLGP